MPLSPRERHLALAPLRLLCYVGMLGIAGYMASLVDGGFTRGWPIGGRAAWVMAMCLLLLNGIVRGANLVASLFDGEGGAGLSVAARGYLNFFSALLVAGTIGLAGAVKLGIAHGAVAIGMLGVGFIFMGLSRGEWFRLHPGVQALDRVLTPRGTRLFYVSIGVLLLAVGVIYGVRT